MTDKGSAALIRLGSFAGFIVLWQLAVWLLQPALLPGPVAVLERLLALMASGELPQQLLVTLMRVLSSFGAAMLIGLLLGVAMALLST